MGTVVLDTGVVIGLRDAADAHHDTAREAIAAARLRGDELTMAASALAEALVQPARRGHATTARWYDFVRRLPVTILPIDENVAFEAAFLRAEHPALRLPDALVIATARVHGADTLITTDRRWPTRKALKLAGELVVL